MKKNYLLGAALMALTWTSCTQDDSLDLVGEENRIFTGGIELVESRTSLGLDNKISWVENDKLSIFTKNNINREYRVSVVTGGTANFEWTKNVVKPEPVEDFENEVKGNYAVYPYDSDNTIDASTGVLSAPVKADYGFKDRASFISSALMAAKSSGEKFNFMNVQGFLRLRLYAEIPEDYAAIRSVKLTSEANVLSGIAEITWANGIPSAKIVIEKGNSLTVTMDESKEFKLSEPGSQSVELYVPILPMSFGADDVTMVVTFTDDKTYTKKFGTPFSINRREVTGLKHTIGVDDNFTGDTEGAEEAWDGETATELIPVMDETTGEKYYPIVKASDLAGLAALVNGTSSTSRAAVGKINVKLTGDIDLGGHEWTPIGTKENPYMGVFDGNNFTIKNLTVTGYNSNVGLFGNTREGEIKNLKVENAKVSGRTNVGVVSGQPYTSKYTNITVKGHVEVNGMAYVGGVGGKNAYANWENITVDVDASSYVNANSIEDGKAYRTYVGGVIGFNGEGSHSFKNITSNINVKGSTCDVGGLFGIAHYGNQFENCNCTGNVEIYEASEEDEAQEIGGIAGVWNNGGADVIFTNCTFEGELKANNNYVINTNKFGNLVCSAYKADGAGKLIIDGVEYRQTAGGVIVFKDGVYEVANAAELLNVVGFVEDGQTIKLTDNVTFDEQNRYDNGGWWDGLGYSGDKSFTIDLGGKIISQNGALNDYLMWFKNVGTKDNVITIKNGTLDAGTTAFCALCTANSHENQLTVNLENVTLYNEKSDGSTVKIRAGSVLNVNAGTKIIGKDSYLGIENWNATVNIYDGAEIYMNGKTSYNGCLVGVGGNGTINVYGGYGKGVSGGFIAMTSGGTINVSGGEWIANTDGTYANNNKSVLVAQSDKQYNAGAGNAVVNVTGGTFKGGYNCYGNAVGDAQINIKGGNFNADPTNYVVAGYEVTGNYTVGKPQALADLEAAIAKGGNVTLTNDVTLLESLKIENTVVLDLNGKTITAPLFSAFEVKAGGDLTLKNGKVVAYESTVRAIGGKAVIENGEYTSTGTALDSPATYRYSLDCREGGELVINGGTFKSNNGMINVSSTVTINGGKFENIVEKTMTRHFAYVSAPLIINGGEFYNKANSGAGGCFFCGAADSGDIQVKGGKFTSLWTSDSVNKIFESYYGGTITVTGGLFNTNGGIATFVTENTDEATKAAYPYVAK